MERLSTGAKNPVPLPKSLGALRLHGGPLPVMIPWESAGPDISDSDEDVQAEEAMPAALGSCRRKGDVSQEIPKPCHGWEVTTWLPLVPSSQPAGVRVLPAFPRPSHPAGFGCRVHPNFPVCFCSAPVLEGLGAGDTCEVPSD